jgi:hypothetical protein
MRHQQASQVHRRAKPARRHQALWAYTYQHAQHTEETLFWFLPAHTEEQDPIVAFAQHNVRMGAGWSYHQPCTRTGSCPVCAYRALHDPTFRLEADRQRYASNVLIYRDPITPANNGEVGIFEYGSEIHDLLLEEIEAGVNVFDPFQSGTLFCLRAAWYTPKAVPKYRSESYAVPDSPVWPGALPARHRLLEYPPVHDDEELRYQFSRTLGSLSNDANATERVGNPTEVLHKSP